MGSFFLRVETRFGLNLINLGRRERCNWMGSLHELRSQIIKQSLLELRSGDEVAGMEEESSGYLHFLINITLNDGHSRKQ